MLKQNQRIKKTRDLERVYRQGRTVHTPALVIKFVEQNLQTNSQLGAKAAFVVSKKVSKKAVERNRIKRILREQARLKIKTLKPGSYIVVAKANALKLPSAILRKELLYGLEKIVLSRQNDHKPFINRAKIK